MQKNSGIQLKQLVLIGHRKNYVVPFFPGVNIVYGDADTGKSSILRMVYYMLGGKRLHLDNEIASSITSAVLELEINDAIYCIRRDVFDHSRKVEVFECSFSDIGNNFPTKYHPNLSQDRRNISLSEFLMDRMGLPAVHVKQAPTKDESPVSRLSILDLLRYCYMDQDEVGSPYLFNSANYVLEVKNKEVFKYIFNLLDGQISEVDRQIQEKAEEKKELQNKFEVITEFLQQTEFDTIEQIEEELATINEQDLLLDRMLFEIKESIINSADHYKQFKLALNRVYSDIAILENKRRISVDNLDRFTRLRNEFSTDIEKLKVIQEAMNVIGSDNIKSMGCPICEAPLNVAAISKKFSIPENDNVKHEINALSRRVREISSVLDENRQVIEDADVSLRGLYDEREKASLLLDEETNEAITPYLSQRDSYIRQKALLHERHEKYAHELKVRNLQATIAEQIGRLEGEIGILKVKRSALQDNAPSMDDVLETLSGELRGYLRHINIKNNVGVSISAKTYLPVVRNVDYKNINSGGLRTITSIGYLGILQSYALNTDINLPNLMMIDTVGKYLGKTKSIYQDQTTSSADEDEGISDPHKYKNIYEYLIDLSSRYEEKGKKCQILLVDNDVPADIAKAYSGFVVAHYSSSGANGLAIGLIDDWDTHNGG